jgi:hypothetical protein
VDADEAEGDSDNRLDGRTTHRSLASLAQQATRLCLRLLGCICLVDPSLDLTDEPGKVARDLPDQGGSE